MTRLNVTTNKGGTNYRLGLNLCFDKSLIKFEYICKYPKCNNSHVVGEIFMLLY